MKHTILILMSLLFVLNVSNAQNVDSFTVSDLNPYVCDTVTFQNYSTNFTSLKWGIYSTQYIQWIGSSTDTFFRVVFYDTSDCVVKLIIGRGSKYDTISKHIVFNAKFKPMLTLNGKEIDTVEVGGSPYLDFGYNANITCRGIKSYLKIGSVNTSIVGKYTILYVAEDNGGRIDTIKRIVYVVDRQDPIVNLRGYNTIEIDLLCNFIDPGISATDNYCKNLIIRKIGIVDSSKVGEYKIIYEVEDSSGNSVSVTRTVQVVNLRPPYFEKTSIEIPVFSKYTDGFKINHHCCELKDIEVFTIGKVDTAKIGTYILKVWFKDCRGTVSDTAVQVVKVVDKTPPVIKLLSKYNNDIIYVSDTIHFNPLDSIKVTDNYDPNPKVYLTGTYYSVYLKNFKKGVYTIIFNAEDQSGNKAIPVNFYEYVHINSIPEFSDNVFRIFPNPGNGQFTLEIKNPEPTDFIRIIDMTGKQILTIPTLQQSNKITLPDFCQGMYILQVVTQKGVFNERIISK